MATKYILAGLAAVFLVTSLVRVRRGGRAQPQVRVWLLIALIFGVVSAWLFYRE